MFSLQERSLRFRVLERVEFLSLSMGVTFSARNTFKQAPHWFWDYRGKRLLNFWPTTGTFWDPKSRYRGKERSIKRVLEMVETIKNERART